MGERKLLDFQASISDVKQVSPLFSTCKVRVLYTGKNRNMSIITKDAVEKALSTMQNIPIVGEFNEANEDYKGHGGAIDLDSYKYIHTTKPYGVVPESATYSWEDVRGADGAVRQYLTLEGCILWTGRYEEAYSIVEKGKGQSMEIEVTDGRWDEKEEAYRIDNFMFSALCILGDDVEPAFEDANITAYSLDKDSFKQEFSLMMAELQKELDTSLSKEGEDDKMLKELLEKYSVTMEYLTEKGLKFEDISEDELEDKIKEVLEVEPEATEPITEPTEPTEPVSTEPVTDPVEPITEPTSTEPVSTEPVTEPVANEFEVENANLKAEIANLESQLVELEELRQFKLEVEKSNHEAEVQKMFSDFQLTEEDVKDIDIHKFSKEQMEDECYKILGRKMASKKNFSKDKNEEPIRLPVNMDGEEKEQIDKPVYGDLFDNYAKKQK